MGKKECVDLVDEMDQSILSGKVCGLFHDSRELRVRGPSLEE